MSDAIVSPSFDHANDMRFSAASLGASRSVTRASILARVGLIDVCRTDAGYNRATASLPRNAVRRCFARNKAVSPGGGLGPGKGLWLGPESRLGCLALRSGFWYNRFEGRKLGALGVINAILFVEGHCAIGAGRRPVSSSNSKA
jgi:hypothetical protein